MGVPVEAVSDLSSTIATIITGLGIGIVGLHQYLKKPKDPTPQKDVAVVGASIFSDRPLMEALIRSNEALIKSGDCLREALEETNELLRAENIDRRVEAGIRAALRDRGTKEKD